MPTEIKNTSTVEGLTVVTTVSYPDRYKSIIQKVKPSKVLQAVLALAETFDDPAEVVNFLHHLRFKRLSEKPPKSE